MSLAAQSLSGIAPVARRFVHDEHDVSWLVSPGDTANAACLVLERHGYREIVLPRTLLTGVTVDDTMIERAESGLSSVTPAQIRLLDCMEVLNETSNN